MSCSSPLSAQIGRPVRRGHPLATALKTGGGLTAEQATAAPEAGARAALAELADALTPKGA